MHYCVIVQLLTLGSYLCLTLFWSILYSSNSGKEAARPSVQALVDSYYLEKGELSPQIPNFNTLLMLIEITNASYESSGYNQSLKILEDGV